MNYRNAAVVSVVASLMAGCAYLPVGHSSRTGHGRVEVNNTEKLFSNDPEQQTGAGDAANVLAGSTPGLKVRKSKRGNMDSYVVRGQRYFTLDESDGYSARGLASWYGPNFHGRTASNGEVYDMYKMTAAHKTLPLPTFARVTHIDNGKSIIVKINDRGPFSGDRLIDLSFAAALELGMVNDGTAMVQIQAISAQDLVAISGPKNKLGVDFYYDAGSETRNASLPSSELFTSDDASEEGVVVKVEDNSVEGQSIPLAGVEGVQLPVAAISEPLLTALPSLPVANASVENAGFVATSEAVPVGVGVGVVVEVPESVSAEYLEVIVPGRKQPAIEVDTQVVASKTAEESGIFPSEEMVPVKLPAVALNAESETMPQVQQVPVALLDTAAVSPLAVAAVPAMVAPKKAEPVSSIRYYIQAGVYADVQDAEKIAVDIVLEIPEEEVHVKPLKDSHMYRVTVGPIVKSEHAKAVAAKLTETGLDNYTVKINEI